MPRNRSLEAHVAALNDRYRLHAAHDVLTHALRDTDVGPIALVSSFGAESVVLLHMVSIIQPRTPILFVDTLMLFAETLDYQHELSDRLGLKDLRIIRAGQRDIDAQDPDGLLMKRDPDACCDLRKTIPLQRALMGFDGWITGRKRFQGPTRQALEFFEIEEGAGRQGTGRIKVNPLAHWTPDDVRTYIEENRLPKHPLVAQGYPSIGCMPCTTQIKPGEDPRAGRWRGDPKTECGIHFKDGKIVRTGALV